ncbi:MAG: UbiA family prenyltransferase [Candidatus Thermoplasmatota archaeon]
MRPLNCLISSFSILIVMVTLLGIAFVSYQILLSTAIGMGVVFFFTAAGNTLNDYMDRETDEINHPDRPIPSGEVSPKTALVYSSSMFGIGIILSFLLELWIPQIIVISAVVLMIAYETRFKREGLEGNLIISALTGMLFVFGGSIYGEFYLPTFLGLLAFLATVGREIVKDIQDLKGDMNRNTFPMRVGPKKAEMTASGFIISAVILSPFPYILNLLSIYYLLVILVADAIFIYSLLLLKSAEKSQRFIKFAMIIALIAFLIGGLI